MWLKVLFLFLVLLVLFVLWKYVFVPSEQRLWRGAVTPFELDDLQRVVGTIPLRVENYQGQLDPDGSVMYHPLEHWFTELTLQTSKQSHLVFPPSTKHPVGRYFLQWWETQLPSLPAFVREKIREAGQRQAVGYGFRLSNGGWHFPNHFDCIDNFVVVVAGQRKVKLDKKTIITLYPGDILYMPMGQEHEFWCDTPSDTLNVLFNVNLQPLDVKQCKERFATFYPKQQQRVETKFEYT